MVSSQKLAYTFLFQLLILASTATAAFAQAAAETEPPTPLLRAHAHNDYYHPRPLLDALDQGFTSVEADVFLHNDDLFVAHSWIEIKTDRTLESLYLKPLHDRAKANGGWIYKPEVTVTLMIDIKRDGEAAYAKLDEQLKPYRDMLTRFEDGKVIPGAVTIVLSGARPTGTVAKQSPRWVGIDGRVSDLKGESSSYLMPMVSDSWKNHFKWNGVGEMPANEKKRLDELVRVAHDRGHRLRFWAAPDNETVWKVLYEAGVDAINTDHLAELSAFLREQN